MSAESSPPRRQGHRIWRLWPVVIAMLTGCGTMARQPATIPVVPARFSLEGTAPVADRWWLGFADSSLTHLVESALAGNPGLQGVGARLAQAQAISRRERAEQIPAITLQGSATRSATGGSKSTELTLGAAASYEIDLWGRLGATRRAVLLDLRGSQEDVTTAAITLSATVGKTYYDLVEQQAQLELLDRQLTAGAQVLELVALRFRQGQVQMTDVLRQRQFNENLRGERTQIRSRATVLDHQLAVLLGRTPTESVVAPPSFLLPPPALPQTGLPADLIRRRPDLRRAYFAVAAADQRVAAAISERFPRLSLTARSTTSAEGANDLFSDWLTNVAANLAAPLVDGGRRASEVDRLRAVTAQRLSEYEAIVLTALAQVEDALARDAQQQELVASLIKQRTLARQVTELAQDHYRTGGVDYLRVLDAQQNEYRLERAVLSAHRTLIHLRIDLCRALAGGWSDGRMTSQEASQ